MIRGLLRARLCKHTSHQLYYKHFIHSDRPLETTHTSQPESSYKSSLLLTLVLGAVIGYLYNKRDKFSSVAVDTNVHTQQNFTPVELTAGKKLSRQEKSFSENASYMCQGVLYMSPAEFLKVVTKTGHDISEDSTSIIKVKLKEANKWLSVTSKRSSNQDRFLRDVWSKGFLSYPDYRFLLSALIKPKNHFKVAFNIFDRDKSGDIELSEFIQVQNSILGRVPEILDPRGSQFKSSLLLQLFGRDGKGKLSFEEFSKFIDSLQREVLHFEFNKYAKGNATISSEDFAQLILQYNTLPLNHIRSRLHQRFGENMRSHPEFDFSQYDQFNTLLLNLEDFSTLLNIYTVPGKGVKKREFNQAVLISCGLKFDPDLLEVLYAIFDKDRDGFLSYDEFLDTMARRQKRGSAVGGRGWERYRTCVRSKVRAQSRVV